MAFEIVRTATLRRNGMSRRAVDGLPRVEGVPGVRLIGDRPEDARLPRIRAAWERAPAGSVLAGWAAAALHGVPSTFFDGTDGQTPLPVDLSVPADAGNYDTRGLRIRRSRVAESHKTQIAGMTVSTGPRTTLDLARWASGEARRLAMLDVGARFQLISRETFADFLDPLGGLHRLRRVRELLPLVSTRAESVPESELRYHWIQVGLPRPVVNQPIHDRFGNFVARVDLCDPESGLAAEYQGYVHLLDGAAELDAARTARLQKMNLTVEEVWNADRGRFEGKLLDAYARARRRDQRLDAWSCPTVEDW